MLLDCSKQAHFKMQLNQ